MISIVRLGVLVGLAGLIAGCNTTGKNGVSSSVSTHIDMSQRSVTAYSRGLNSSASSNLIFKTAHSKVNQGCLKPELKRLLRKVERHYGKSVVITSGYRSKAYNRRVRGARKSQHIYCKAADIRVPGVSKSALAKYARTLKGIGGVGVYCRSSAVHLDVGPRRDWYWGCGKKKRRRSARRK